MEKDLLTKEELQYVARRAILFQRYIFRRTYGTYYAVWAAAISCFFVIPFALGSIGEYFVPVLQIATGVAATFVTVQSFAKAIRAGRLSQVLQHGKGSPYLFYVTAWWIAFVALVYATFHLSSYAGYTSLYLMLISVVYFLALHLKRCFPEKVPLEGKVAVGSYAFSATASFILSIVGISSLAAAPWLLTITCWIFASINAFKHANEELLEEEV